MKKKLKQLVLYSYTNGQLDQKIVETIANKLNRRELKTYIRLLKNEENKRQVQVTAARELRDSDRKKIQNLFPDKEILYTTDPAMISGIRIVDKDVEYEFSLNQTFDDIINHLSKYD